MAIEKVYYNGKCIMTVDMDYVKEDSMYEYLNEIYGMFHDRAYKEFGIENKIKSEVRKVWKENEDLYELKNQVEQKVEQAFEDNPFEKEEQLYRIMKERLNDEEFELFTKLRNEEVKCFNKLEQNYFEGKDCLGYVWVERNGQKRNGFVG